MNFYLVALAIFVSLLCEVKAEEIIVKSTNKVVATNSSNSKTRPNNNVDCGSTSPGQANADYAKPVNHGRLDDRTCAYEYYETLISGTKFGAYKIKHQTNNVLPYHLQPRVERVLTRVKKNDGNFIQLSATFRIGQVGNTGTYIAQVKGAHIGQTNDPAIVLFRADPYPSATNQKQYKIYAEYVTVRGGSVVGIGRAEEYITTVNRYSNFSVFIKAGFTGNPVDKHTVQATINGVAYSFIVPNPEIGLNTEIRYGAYRVNGGEADVRVANTNVVERNL